MTTIDRTREFFEIDRGGSRYTHSATGDTLLKHDWLREDRNFAKWDALRREYFGRHPDAVAIAVRDDHGKFAVVGDVQDFLWMEGFKVGDMVVTTASPDRSADCVRRIVGELPNGDPRYLTAADATKAFLLEDGETLYWNTMEDCWQTRSMAGDRSVRVRRPWYGDDVEALRIPDGDMLAKALPKALDLMQCFRRGLHADQPIARADIERAMRDLEILVPQLDAEQVRIAKARRWHDLHEPVGPALASACAAALEAAGQIALRAEEAGIHIGWEHADVGERAKAVVATMRERGTHPITADAVPPLGSR